MCIYTYIYISNHENNVSSRLQPQWLCDNSCSWAHDVHHGPKCISCHKHCVKGANIRSYSGPHFPAFGLNTERYGVSLRIQSEFGKKVTRITLNTYAFHDVKAIMVITGRTHCFRGCICNTPILIISDLGNLCVVDHL